MKVAAYFRPKNMRSRGLDILTGPPLHRFYRRGVVYNRNWKKFLIARDWRLLCAYVNRGSLLISVDSDYSEVMQSFLFGSGIANEPASTTQPVSLRAESCSAVQIRPAVDGPQIHYFGRVRLKSSYTVYIKRVLRPNSVTSWMYNLIDWLQPRWRRPWKRTSSSSGDSSWPLVLSSRFFSSSKVLPHVCSNPHCNNPLGVADGSACVSEFTRLSSSSALIVTAQHSRLWRRAPKAVGDGMFFWENNQRTAKSNCTLMRTAPCHHQGSD
ncbi:hypothetical protein T02_4947 [Trichinella nativa]|uniref:Uncharacterized protein n=1 Tax=Trichinella nativa TaxID=6335 RepID=A0A0V1KWS3_9BILA|nr:hypothetical protein T02_4947 [Trichinella nativa]